METIYFQPLGIKPQYCEVGMIHESDSEHIWYLNEPCKILISDVKIKFISAGYDLASGVEYACS